MKQILEDFILIPALKRLFIFDYNNIKYDVSERNICARLAHYLENIIREYDQNNKSSYFEDYYADVEYNRMGDGSLKQFENSMHRPQYMVSDLLIQSRGFERNLLAVEMKKKKASKKEKDKDRERLRSLVSPPSEESPNRCVHDTMLGVFIVYSPEEVVIDFYENVNGTGQLTHTRKMSVPVDNIVRGKSRNL